MSEPAARENDGPRVRTVAVRPRARIPWDVAAFAALVILAMAPVFVGRYLPFFDYPAHLTVPAALRWRGVADSHVAELWSLHPAVVPNSLHYAFTWAGSFVVSIETASRIFVALFAIAALPLATTFTLRSFGRDWRLAVLTVPLAWNRGLWYGFIGYCAALSASLLVVALVEREVRGPSTRRAIVLGVLSAVLPFVHFFVMLTTVALGGVLLLVHAGVAPIRRLLRCAALLGLGPLVMLPWVWDKTHPGPGANASAHVAAVAGSHAPGFWAARPPLREYVRLLPHWFMDGYMGRADEVVAVVLLLALALLIGRPARTPRSNGGGACDPRARAAPLVLAGVSALGYFVLPFEIHEPFDWWAMNVRLIPLVFLWLVVSVAPGALDRTARRLLLPVAVTAAGFFLFVADDIANTFNGRWGMAGFEQVIAQVPRGARVLGLYTDYRQRPHYAHYPFYYASSYAFLRAGGLVAPYDPIPYSWTNPVLLPATPPDGDAGSFRFEVHAAGFSHFLVRTCAGTGCVPDPLDRRDEVARVAEGGAWRLYVCVREPCMPPPR